MKMHTMTNRIIVALSASQQRCTDNRHIQILNRMKKLRQRATAFAILIMALLPASALAEAKHPLTYNHPFRAETTDFGQMEAILAANDGNLIDSLVVAGPVNKADIKAIMKYAVDGELVCLNMESAEIENDSIPANSFRVDAETIGSKKIKRIILPESVTYIGKLAFAFLPIEEINIPGSLKRIESQAFYANIHLNCNLIFPDGVEVIPRETFAFCQELEEMPVFPSSLKEIGLQAFIQTGVKELEFQEGLEEIGLQGFAGCFSLKRVVLPQSCTALREWAFNGDEALEEVVLPDELEEISEGVFESCRSLSHITINAGCRAIRRCAFNDAGLRSVDFNAGLEILDERAFKGTDLTEITLPPSLQWVGKDCFAGNYNLKTVWCPCAMPPVCWYDESVNTVTSPFGSLTDLQDATLYVPVGAAEMYRNSHGWGLFGNIAETSEFPGLDAVPVIGSGSTAEGTVYDLSGRKVSDMRDGEIYIRDGKKFVR